MSNIPILKTTKASLPGVTSFGNMAVVTDQAPGWWLSGNHVWFGNNSEIINVKSFVTGGNGTSANPYTGWDTAITAAGWKKGARYVFTNEFYSFNQLSITVPVILQGQGWNTLNSDFFGGSWLNASNTGTVLYCTATSGIGLNLTGGPGNYYGYSLRDLMLVGPGTGTAIGVSMGTSIIANVNSFWQNVFFANFYLAVDLENTEDCAFNFLSFNGNVTALRLGLNTNQNLFFDTNINHGTLGIDIFEAAQNAFYGGLWQQVTTGVNIVSAQTILFESFYIEASTDIIVIDSTTFGSSNIQLKSFFISATNLIKFTGAITLNGLSVEDCQYGQTMTIPSNVINGFIKNVTTSAPITNNSHNCLILNGTTTSSIEYQSYTFDQLSNLVADGTVVFVTDAVNVGAAWGAVVTTGGSTHKYLLLRKSGSWLVIG